MEVLILDNHDSFTYNIAHIIRNHSGVNLQIITADKIKLIDIDKYNKLVFSPGPDIPLDDNIMERILSRYENSVSILGICLGLQAIVKYFGGKLNKLEEVVHGRTKTISLTDKSSQLFKNIPVRFEAGLYHSWIADWKTLPECLEVTAVSSENRIMAIRHKNFDIEAVQFHPESIMTPTGNKIINNWLENR